MTAATLDLATWADGQLDSDQPLQQLAHTVAALWSAGTALQLQPAAVTLDDTHARVVLAEPWPPGEWEEIDLLLRQSPGAIGSDLLDAIRQAGRWVEQEAVAEAVVNLHPGTHGL